MNKIIMTTEETLGGNIDNLVISNKETHLNINKNTYIKNLTLNVKEFNLTFHVQEKASFHFESILKVEDIKGVIHLNLEDNTHVYFGLGIQSSFENYLDILTTLQGSHTNCEVKVRMVGEEKSKMMMQLTGSLLKNTVDNNFTEDVKYLFSEDAYIEVLPELLVASNDTLANHNMSVGKMSEEELFYLESKGLTALEAQEIYREGFIESVKKERDSYE